MPGVRKPMLWDALDLGAPRWITAVASMLVGHLLHGGAVAPRCAISGSPKSSDNTRCASKLRKCRFIAQLRRISGGCEQALSHFTKKSSMLSSINPTHFARHTDCSIIHSALANLSPENPFSAPVPKLAGLIVVGRPNLRCTFSPAFSISPTTTPRQPIPVRWPRYGGRSRTPVHSSIYVQSSPKPQLHMEMARGGAFARAWAGARDAGDAYGIASSANLTAPAIPTGGAASPH